MVLSLLCEARQHVIEDIATLPSDSATVRDSPGQNNLEKSVLNPKQNRLRIYGHTCNGCPHTRRGRQPNRHRHRYRHTSTDTDTDTDTDADTHTRTHAQPSHVVGSTFFVLCKRDWMSCEKVDRVPGASESDGVALFYGTDKTFISTDAAGM